MSVQGKYKHLQDDSKITAIGHLFRGVGNKQWAINLDFSGKKSKSVRFGAIPTLARRRVLNPTKVNKRAGVPVEVTISNAQHWQQGKLQDCAAYFKAPKGSDKKQNCFISTESGQSVYIPQLELARVLFYHDQFMARLSLQHNALAEDFFLDFSDGPKVFVREGAEYPIYYFNREDNRRFLSWVLMDVDARKSFESISSNLLLNATRRGNYDQWNFGFKPPPLTGVKLGMTGWSDRDSGTFIVWEIHSLELLPSTIQGEVNFFHPKYERKVGGKPTKPGKPKGKPPEENELNDDEPSDADKASVTLRSELVKITFREPFVTNRIPANLKPVKNSKGDGDREILGNELSANEKEESGNLPGGAWNNLDDQTDDAHLYLSKFHSFLEMVGYLESSHNCTVLKKNIVKLPRLNEGKKHWLLDTENPRCLVVIELTLNGESITLLEIDTSDGAASLSTMMLKVGFSGWLENNLGRIKMGIMKKSLGWPTDIFKENVDADKISGIPHPKSKHFGSLKSEEIEPWAQRFVNWMLR